MRFFRTGRSHSVVKLLIEVDSGSHGGKYEV